MSVAIQTAFLLKGIADWCNSCYKAFKSFDYDQFIGLVGNDEIQMTFALTFYAEILEKYKSQLRQWESIRIGKDNSNFIFEHRVTEGCTARYIALYVVKHKELPTVQQVKNEIEGYFLHNYEIMLKID